MKASRGLLLLCLLILSPVARGFVAVFGGSDYELVSFSLVDGTVLDRLSVTGAFGRLGSGSTSSPGPS